jgi:tetratricopeptide (TPR) repeat protein
VTCSGCHALITVAPITAHPDLVDDLASVYDRCAAEGVGTIVFAAGAVGSGRSDLLSDLADRLCPAPQRPLTLRGSAVDGTFRTASSSGHGTATPVVESALGVAAAVYPLAGLLGQLIAASRAVAEHFGSAESPPLASIEHLSSALRIAAHERPVVCLVDEADATDGCWWSNLLLFGFADEIATSLPILLVLTVEGGRLPGSHSTDEPDALHAARVLVDEGSARWLPVPLVDASAMSGITGDAEADVVTSLAALAQRHAGWASRLWKEWRATGIVERDTDLGPWRFAAGQPDLSGSLTDLLRDRLRRVFDADVAAMRGAWDLLTYAAVEGRYFTAEAVALATRTDPAAVIETLLRLSPTVVEPTDSSHATTRFRFVSPLTRPALLRFEVTRDKRVRATKAMINALNRVYGPPSSAVAGTLAALHAYLEDRDAATILRDRANARMPDDEAIVAARVIANVHPAGTRHWDGWRCRGAARTVLAGAQRLHVQGDLDEATALCGLAAVLAERAGDLATEARTLSLLGVIEPFTGRPDSARSHLERASAIWQRLGRHDGNAEALTHLARLHGLAGDRATALQISDDVLSICKRHGLRTQAITVHLQVGNLAIGWLDLEMARRATKAAGQLSDAALPVQMGLYWENRGSIARHDRDIDAAIDAFTRAKCCYEPAGLTTMAASARRGIAIATSLSNDVARARRLLEEETAVAEAMNDVAAVVEVQHALALLEARERRRDAAIRRLQRCIELYNELGQPTVALRVETTLAKVRASFENAHPEAEPGVG